MYHVYLVECEDGSIYTGIATDVARRFDEHKKGVGARYTRAHRVKKIIYTEPYSTRSEALVREAQIKRFSKQKKLSLAG